MNPRQPGPRPLAVDVSRSPHAKSTPVSPLSVKLTGAFWTSRWDRNASVSLHAQAQRMEEYGNFDNFRRLSNPGLAPFRGKVFNDSDVYKWAEAASWTLAQRDDALLARKLDEAIGLIQSAQCPDGYLNTYYALERADERWSNLRDNHELYCGGHLIQAAIAHHRALADTRLLAVAIRFADLVCAVFGPLSERRNPGIDGHQSIEPALVELYRETGDERYLTQARHFVDARGHGTLHGGWFGLEYFQDHAPFRQQTRMAGHAVRALYYNAGITDLYLETGDATLLNTLETMWGHMASRQMYISGGLGSRHHGEALGDDYELPNAQAYTETCAAIGSLMWNQRMMAATADARYIDLYEHVLYNAMLPGWSLDGERYFYVNPLANDGSHQRLRWYECACCPPNIARTVASLSGSMYSTGANAVYVQLYADSHARIELQGKSIGIVQQTRYPWDGDITLTVDACEQFDLMLRIPAWCASGAALSVNAETVSAPLTPGSFVRVARRWRPGDVVRLLLPMTPRLMESHPHVLENTGRVSLARGPILYCIEAADHPDASLTDLEIGSTGIVTAQWEEDLLGGIVVLRTLGQVRLPDEGWDDRLYRERSPLPHRSSRPVTLTAIPYFAWHNRETGPMQVWTRYAEQEVTYG